MSVCGQSAAIHDFHTRRRLARKAKLVFGDAAAFMDALEREGVYTTDRTARRWMKVMSDKGMVQRAVRVAIRKEADRQIAELTAIRKGISAS